MISPRNKTADQIFQAELNRLNHLYSLNEEGQYVIQVGDVTVHVSLENIRRDFERDNDEEAVKRFAQQVSIEHFQESSDWQTAKTLLRYSLEPADYVMGFEDTLHETITDDLVKVFVLVSTDGSRITWVSSTNLSSWNVGREEILRQANANMEQLLEKVTIECHDIDGVKLGYMVTEELPFKASFILTQGFRELVRPTHDWPVYIVAPTRDFVYILAKKNRNFLGKLGSVVLREYHESGYPITADVLEIGDDGITAIGSFRSDSE